MPMSFLSGCWAYHFLGKSAASSLNPSRGWPKQKVAGMLTQPATNPKKPNENNLPFLLCAFTPLQKHNFLTVPFPRVTRRPGLLKFP
jgi:hypothetical protein